MGNVSFASRRSLCNATHPICTMRGMHQNPAARCCLPVQPLMHLACVTLYAGHGFPEADGGQVQASTGHCGKAPSARRTLTDDTVCASAVFVVAKACMGGCLLSACLRQLLWPGCTRQRASVCSGAARVHSAATVHNAASLPCLRPC